MVDQILGMAPLSVVNALSTVALAILTAALVYYTRALAIATSQPEVVAAIEPHPPSPILMDLVVQNTGNATAHNVIVQMKPEPSLKDLKNADGRALKNISLIRPGQVHRTPIGRHNDYKEETFTILVSWCHSQKSAETDP